MIHSIRQAPFVSTSVPLGSIIILSKFYPVVWTVVQLNVNSTENITKYDSVQADSSATELSVCFIPQHEWRGNEALADVSILIRRLFVVNNMKENNVHWRIKTCDKTFLAAFSNAYPWLMDELAINDNTATSFVK